MLYVKAYADELEAYATEGVAKLLGGVYYDFRDDAAEGYVQMDMSAAQDVFRADLRAPHYVKIYRYTPDILNQDFTKPPKGTDYGGTNLTRRLFRQRNFVKGELQSIEFCAGYAGQGLSGPIFNDAVVRENHVYARDANGFPISRTVTITWLKEDGSDHPDTKVYTKFYSKLEAIREGKVRRKNLMDQLQIDVLGLIMMTETALTYDQQLALAQAFANANVMGMQAYVELNDKAFFIGSIQADTTTDWLDNLVPNGGGATIRDFALAALS